MSLRETILTSSYAKLRPLHVPEWGCDVYVKALTARERDQFEIEMDDLKAAGRNRLENIRARLVAKTLCDESGTLQFSETDLDTLGSQPASALARVFDLATKLAGMGRNDLDELAAELKNGRAASSPTA